MTARTTASLRALLAAALFGASTPVAKALLEAVPPAMLAGLLYLGAASFVLPSVVARARRGERLVPADRRNRLRLLGAVAFGGGLGPLLVMTALAQASAASVSMWLNLETVATAALGLAVFREHLGRLAAIGNLGVFAAGLLLAWDSGPGGRCGERPRGSARRDIADPRDRGRLPTRAGSRSCRLLPRPLSQQA